MIKDEVASIYLAINEEIAAYRIHRNLNATLENLECERKRLGFQLFLWKRAIDNRGEYDNVGGDVVSMHLVRYNMQGLGITIEDIESSRKKKGFIHNWEVMQALRNVKFRI